MRRILLALAGAAALIPKHAYTPSGAAWFRERGQWGTQPRIGAIVYFQWPSMNRIAHVGIVESVRGDGGVVVIEGNTDSKGGRTGGKVMRQVRRANIAGYGYPAYGGASTLAAAAPAALDVDGELGPMTWAALQRVLGVDADGEATHLSQWAGLGRRSPVLAAAFTFLLLALAGIPLTSGFIAKVGVFSAAVTGGIAWLAVIGVLASAAAAFFYLRVVVLMYFTEPSTERPTVVASGWLTGTAIAIGTVATLVLGVFPQPFLELAGAITAAAP